MDKGFYSILVLILLQYQMCECGYCKDAVDSVEIVTSCPTSKREWDIAARKKNCERIASRQKCDSVEKFKYHCVINGFRNEMVEVCAPSRIIFGHCTEFNVHGGVIQDQLSTPCNNTFPKCEMIYNSLDAYKFPDCYNLVTNGVVLSTMPNSSATDQPGFVETATIIAAVNAISFLIFIIIIIIAFRNKKKFPCCSFTSQPTTSSEKNWV